MQISVTNDVTVMQVQVPTAPDTVTVQVPSAPQVLAVQVPGTQGSAGPTGPAGAAGPANHLTIGTVTTGSAAATITGTAPNQVLNLTLPQGQTGSAGAAANMSIGTISTLSPGASATATITGTAPNYTLNLGIPQGATGSGAVDATTTSKGSIQLAGDLSGTAAAPTVTVGTHHTHTSSQISDGTSAATASTAVVRDINADASFRTVLVTNVGASTHATNKGYVDNADTTTLTSAKTYADGKVSIAGDLGGTAAAPTVTGGTHHTHTSSQISDAASAGTASKVMIRDANGRAQVVDPSVAADISTKNYVDTQVATKAAIAGDLGGTAAAPTVTGGTHHGHTSSQITDAASIATPSTVIVRDIAGRAQVVNPSATADIANKSYVDAQIAVVTSSGAPDATTTSKGIIELAGDLGGTALAPTVLVGTHHTHTASQISDGTTVGRTLLTAADAATARSTIGAGTSSLALGTTSTTAAAGNDSRLSDARTPLAHASTHASGAADPVTPAAIGAAATVHTHTSLQISDAVSTATASKVLIRDANGRASVVDPSVSTDIATKNYVDTQVATKAAIAGDLGGTAASPTVISGTNHTHTSSQVSDATANSTASTIVKRDTNGSFFVGSIYGANNPPTAAAELTRKDYVDNQDIASRRPSVNAQTVSYTLVLADERKLVTMTSASALTVTVPLNSSVAFPVGTVLQIQQLGTGAVTIAPAAGVTLDAAMALTMRQNQVYELQKIGTDTWSVMSYGNVTSSGGVNNIVQMTSAAYTALGTKDASTLYVIVG